MRFKLNCEFQMEVVSGHAKADVDSNIDTQIGDTAIVRITPDKTCTNRAVVRFRNFYRGSFKKIFYF